MAEWRYRCPYGHASIEMGAHRFWCEACRKAGRQAAYSKDDLVDLLKVSEAPYA